MKKISMYYSRFKSLPGKVCKNIWRSEKTMVSYEILYPLNDQANTVISIPVVFNEGQKGLKYDHREGCWMVLYPKINLQVDDGDIKPHLSAFKWKKLYETHEREIRKQREKSKEALIHLKIHNDLMLESNVWEQKHIEVMEKINFVPETEVAA